MKLKFYPEKKLGQDIMNIVGKYLDLDKHQVFFFGSRISGKANERSDIDVGIEGPHNIPIEIIAKIKEEVGNLSTLYSIDVVDFSQANEDFKKVAKKNVEIIHSNL